MPDDWYRRTTWTTKDQADFFAKLKRSRGAFHKAQYARIQADSLLSTGNPEKCVSALGLLDMILAEWQDDAQLASVYEHRAECYVILNDLPQAIAAYRRVFEIQRVRRGQLTLAHLSFGWLIATTPLPELYPEALAVLDEFHDATFPVNHYRACVIRAFIMETLGEAGQASDHARSALTAAAAAAKHSGFRNHPKLGLVRPIEKSIHKRLLKLADQ